MNTKQTQRDPHEIESDINQTRARLDDTLQDLEEKLSPQQLLSDAFSYLRHGGANDFFTNLGCTVKQNPMPVALTGVSLGWLIISSSKRNTRRPDYSSMSQSQTTPGAHPLTNPRSSLPVTSSATTTATPSALYGSTGAGVTSYGSDPASVGSSASPTRATPRAGTPGLSANHQGKTHMAKEKAKHMRENMHAKTGRLREKSQSAVGGISHRAQNAGTQVSQFVHDYPLVAGALGLALGAAVGGLLPATRAEDRHMGEMRDKTLERAVEAGNQQADKVQEKVREKAEHSPQPATASTDYNTEAASTASSSSPTPGISSSTPPSDPSKDGPPVRGG